MTEAPTIIIKSYYTHPEALVYHAGRFAYGANNINEKFQEDYEKRKLMGAYKYSGEYDDAEKNKKKEQPLIDFWKEHILDMRALTVLNRIKATTVGELLEINERELRAVKGMGEVTFAKIRNALAKNGFYLLKGKGR